MASEREIARELAIVRKWRETGGPLIMPSAMKRLKARAATPLGKHLVRAVKASPGMDTEELMRAQSATNDIGDFLWHLEAVELTKLVHARWSPRRDAARGDQWEKHWHPGP